MSTTFHNDFHGTSCQFPANEGDVLSKLSQQKLWKQLCGIKNCICSETGVRGRDFILDKIDDNHYLIFKQSENDWRY